MLQLNRPTNEINRDFPDGEQGSSHDIKFYVDIIRRQFPTVVAIASAALLVSIVYLFTAAPLFTSTASMVIDTRKLQLFQQQSVLGDVALDSATVESSATSPSTDCC